MIEWLQGKKTYILAVLTLVAVWASYLFGQSVLGVDHVPTIGECLAATMAALSSMSMRAAIAKGPSA